MTTSTTPELAIPHFEPLVMTGTSPMNLHLILHPRMPPLILHTKRKDMDVVIWTLSDVIWMAMHRPSHPRQALNLGLERPNQSAALGLICHWH